MKQKTLTVDDVQYYRALEAEVRESMKLFEAGLLPLAEQGVKDGGFNVGSYPVEGYYHETPELTKYFNCIRTLQGNYTDKVTPAIQHLHNVYTHPIFGLKQGIRTAINPTDVYYPQLDPVTISPVAEAVTIATQRLADGRPLPDWTTESIMQEAENIPKGTCLVGLALLVDKLHKEKGKYNPVATCAARETTVLSAMKWVVITAVGPETKVDWRVSPKVEAYGKEVVEGYNDLINKYGIQVKRGKGSKNVQRDVRQITPQNVESILKSAPDMKRCVNLCSHDKLGFYHWAIVENNEKHRVVDFYAPQIVTTKEYQNDPKGVLKKYTIQGKNCWDPRTWK